MRLKHNKKYWSWSFEKINKIDYSLARTSQVALVVRNLPAKTGDVRDAGSISESGRPPGEENGNLL